MKELDALRKLAEAADLNIDWIGAGPTRHGDLISTSGKPLFIDSVYLDCDEQDVDGDDYFVCSAGSDEYGQFIAAASPRVVLGLLDEIQMLLKVRDEMLAIWLVEEPFRRQIADLKAALMVAREALEADDSRLFPSLKRTMALAHIAKVGAGETATNEAV